MARVIQFFPRQTVVAVNQTTIYSEVFEVTDYASFVAEFKIHSYFGAGYLSAIFQDTMEPALDPEELWRVVTSKGFSATSGITVSGSGLLRFFRLKLTASGVTGASVSVEGKAFEK